MSGYKYKDTPTIRLKGQWLNEFGFESGREYKAICENEKITIIAKERAPEPIIEPRRSKKKCRR